MGSWNKTCGLSNLHITAGTPVYVFVLEDSREDNHCYSTNLFKPLLLPFESEYNDYGGGENSSGAGFELIMDGIKDQLVEVPLGENKYHDIAVSKEEFGEELFFEAVREDRLTIPNYGDDPIKLQFVMFRKDVVDDILENHVIEKYVGGNKGTFSKWGDEKDYISYKFADVVADLKPLLIDTRTKVDVDSAVEKQYMVFSLFDKMTERGSGNKATWWLRGDNYRYSRIVDIRNLVSNAFMDGSNEALENLEAVLIEHLKAKFIDGFMSITRKTWIPGGHEGSQSNDDAGYRLLCSSIIKVLDKEKEEWED